MKKFDFYLGFAADISFLALIVVVILTFLTSCGSKKEVTTTSTSSERVTRDRTEVNLPGVNLTVEWPLQDTLVIGDTIVKEDPRTGAQLKFYRDKYNRLVSECSTKDTVFVTEYVEIVKEVEKERSEKITKELTFWQRLWVVLKNFWWICLVTIVVWEILRRSLKVYLPFL